MAFLSRIPSKSLSLSLFLQGRRGERWLDSLALIIPGLILSACVYLKRTASHLPCGLSRTSSRGYKGRGQPSRGAQTARHGSERTEGKGVCFRSVARRRMGEIGG